MTSGKLLDLEEIQLDINWEDVTCPICLDLPHNGVLLRCSSHEKGCRPFLCDTDNTHSNCLDRFRSAYGMPAVAKVFSATDCLYGEITQVLLSSKNSSPTCPLCRGVVTGWVIIDQVRMHLDKKKRCCEEKHCTYIGNFIELQKHAKLKHPFSRPSEIDPARQLDWENFQQSSDIVDVLSTIHAEVPHGVVLGDYVLEYGEQETGEEYEVPRIRRRWWTSCILCHVFDKFNASRNRRRLRSRERRQARPGSSSDVDGSASTDNAEYRFDEPEDRFARAGGDAAYNGLNHRYSGSRSLSYGY